MQRRKLSKSQLVKNIVLLYTGPRDSDRLRQHTGTDPDAATDSGFEGLDMPAEEALELAQHWYRQAHQALIGEGNLSTDALERRSTSVEERRKIFSCLIGFAIEDAATMRMPPLPQEGDELTWVIRRLFFPVLTVRQELTLRLREVPDSLKTIVPKRILLPSEEGGGPSLDSTVRKLLSSCNPQQEQFGSLPDHLMRGRSAIDTVAFYCNFGIPLCLDQAVRDFGLLEVADMDPIVESLRVMEENARSIQEQYQKVAQEFRSLCEPPGSPSPLGTPRPAPSSPGRSLEEWKGVIRDRYNLADGIVVRGMQNSASLDWRYAALKNAVFCHTYRGLVLDPQSYESSSSSVSLSLISSFHSIHY